MKYSMVLGSYQGMIKNARSSIKNSGFISNVDKSNSKPAKEEKG